MSTLHHDDLFETCNDMWDIVPCCNGVGAWEVIETESGAVHETFDTIDEANFSFATVSIVLLIDNFTLGIIDFDKTISFS